MKTQYVTYDEKVFDDEQAASSHENKLFNTWMTKNPSINVSDLVNAFPLGIDGNTQGTALNILRLYFLKVKSHETSMENN